METVAWLTQTRSSRKKREERIDLRVTAEHKSLLKEAMELSGSSSLSSFVLQVACEHALHLIGERDRLVLSNRDRDKFLAALTNLPAPSEALRRAARENADLLD